MALHVEHNEGVFIMKTNKNIVSDCFGTLMTVGNHVMFGIGNSYNAEFRQGIINKITKATIHVAELDAKGELKRSTEHCDENGVYDLIIHRRKPLGLIRVFTQTEHEEMASEQENKPDEGTVEKA